MSTSGVLQPDGTRCHSGPSCRRHGGSEAKTVEALSAEIRGLLAPTETASKPAPPYATYLPALSVEQHEAFTSGDCWLLAKTVQETAGYPIIVAGHEEDDMWCHMANLAPDGSVWDANGRHESVDAFLSGWRDYIESNFSDFGKPGVPATWTLTGDDHWRELTADQDLMYESSGEDVGDVASMIAEAVKVHSKK